MVLVPELLYDLGFLIWHMNNCDRIPLLTGIRAWDPWQKRLKCHPALGYMIGLICYSYRAVAEYCCSPEMRIPSLLSSQARVIRMDGEGEIYATLVAASCSVGLLVSYQN